MLLAVCGMYVLSFLSPGFSPLVRTTTILIAPALVWYSLYLATQALFQVELQFARSVMALISGTTVAFALVLIASQVVVEAEVLVIMAGLAFVVGTVVTAAVAGYFTRLHFSLSPHILTNRDWRRWFRAAAPLGFMLFFNLIYFRIDMLLLTVWRPSSEIGSYGYAYKFFEFAIAIPTFVMNSAFPLLSKLDRKSDLFWQAFLKLFTWLTLGAVLVVGIGWAGAPLIVIRPDFSDSVTYLRALLVSVPLFFLTSPLMWLFILLNKQHLLMMLYLVAMVINIGANYLLIPTYGAMASALITGLTELFVLVGGVILLVYRKGKNYGRSR